MDQDPELLIKIVRRLRELTYSQRLDVLNMILNWPEGKPRDFKRLPSSSEVDILVDDQIIQTNAKDISASGIYASTSRDLEHKKEVRVVFSVPGHSKPFKLRGKIIRVDDDGVAIKFVKITKYFRMFLDEIIWPKDDVDDL